MPTNSTYKNKDSSLMKTKHYIIIVVLIILIGISLGGMYFSTKTKPYKEFSPVFVQRGDALPDERFPKNASDTIYAIKMEVRQFKDEMRAELNNNKINWPGVIGSGGVLITSFLGILGLFFSRVDKRRESGTEELRLTIIANHNEAINKLDENTNEHKEIFKMLETVEDITVRKSIEDSFRSISRNYMHYQKGTIPEKLQILITTQGERLIELSEQIMSENFTEAVFDLALLKLDEQCKIGIRQAEELFGKDFIPYYRYAQIISVKEFITRLKKILSDCEFNGKYGRYRRAGEILLDTLIPLTIEQYRKFINEKK